jgi:putative tributyrin esterase
MALMHCEFKSEVLGLSTSMLVILPDPPADENGMPVLGPSVVHPTLWLLHGLSDDHTTWVRRTSIERYVSSLDLAVVMPAVHRSFYTDMAGGVKGYRYWTFISEELPVLARQFFPLSEAREDNFVAGLSMGGYAAFKLALSHPDRYAAGASLSGALDRASLALHPESIDENRRCEWELVFGDLQSLPGSDRDLFHLAKRLTHSNVPAPRLYQCCGTEDGLRAGNLRFKELAGSLGLDLTYEEHPAQHEWGYWDQQIQRVLEWLPVRPRTH